MNLNNYQNIVQSLPKHVTLVAVSKGQPIEKIQMLYDLGQRHFGENFEQELSLKQKSLPSDIEWHFLGNIQSNKLKKIFASVALVQSVSRLKVVKALIDRDDETSKNILLQYKLGNEETKAGLNRNEILEALEICSEVDHVKIHGLMGIAENTTNTQTINNQFCEIADLFKSIKEKDKEISTLSLGMSSDYNLAIDCGSNMVRLGTILFGSRK